MRFYVGNTDKDWYAFLAKNQVENINFWKPGSSDFKALQPSELFLFRLKAPINKIAGGGLFLSFLRLPIATAWEVYGIENGAGNFLEFQKKLLSYTEKLGSAAANPSIGCTILTKPFFWPQELWIDHPRDWQAGIVQGKTYESTDPIGQEIWNAVQRNMSLNIGEIVAEVESVVNLRLDQDERYKERLGKQRLGQSAFRTMVISAYGQRCAVTKERILPILVAGHIKPYALSGPHDVRNGLLLRSDVHTLFDYGYVTVDTEYRIHVSKNIREEFKNGKEYYALHGSSINLPQDGRANPGKEYLEWHNQNVYRE